MNLTYYCMDSIKYKNNQGSRIRWSGVLSVAFLLTLLLASIQAGSAVDIPMTVTGLFGSPNGAGTTNDPSCTRTATTWSTYGTGTYVSYGWPPVGGQCGSQNCPGSLNLNTQSGFGFVPASVGTIQDNTRFKIGAFYHFNNPICTYTQFGYAPLTITLNIADDPCTPGTPDPQTKTFTYTFNLDETPNTPGTCVYPGTTVCPDKVTWANIATPTTFTWCGSTYTLILDGFDPTCTGGDPVITEFITEESTNNLACVYARIVECVVTIDANPSPEGICPPLDSTASFTVEATGPALTYQWYKEAGTTDIKLTNTAPYSGVTTPTLTINPATSSQAGEYYVIVTGSCGTAKTSSKAMLTVFPAPNLNIQTAVTQAKSG